MTCCSPFPAALQFVIEVINITFTFPPFVQIFSQTFQKIFGITLPLDTHTHHHWRNLDTSRQWLMLLCLRDLSRIQPWTHLQSHRHCLHFPCCQLLISCFDTLTHWHSALVLALVVVFCSYFWNSKMGLFVLNYFFFRFFFKNLFRTFFSKLNLNNFWYSFFFSIEKLEIK